MISRGDRWSIASVPLASTVVGIHIDAGTFILASILTTRIRSFKRLGPSILSCVRPSQFRKFIGQSIEFTVVDNST